ncbi:MAG: phospholipase D-like domain-containing protein [Halobacteriales archaeon]|nr:phospholipase D-like domain-containing protein [Halobacteriales archaeon]
MLLAPDNAEARVIALLDGAERTIRVLQVSVGGRDQPFVRALVRAARRGVTVELLLADAWYVRERNRAVADTLNGLARQEGLPLRVRLATPRGRFGKIHAKGAVVDGEHVLLGSLNWNNASARRNREVALVLHGGGAGDYYAAVFDADWQGGRWRLPVGLPAAAALLALAAAAFGRRSIEFEDPERQGVAPVEPEAELRWGP